MEGGGQTADDDEINSAVAEYMERLLE